ncbi:hypothetical protein VPH35_073528 [Triticum aestivum]
MHSLVQKMIHTLHPKGIYSFQVVNVIPIVIHTFSFIQFGKGSLGAVVKLLPCDHEVMGSSPGNSLLQKCRERLRTIDPKWSDPSLDPAQAGATCTRISIEPILDE